jgi:hypothetical protein
MEVFAILDLKAKLPQSIRDMACLFNRIRIWVLKTIRLGFQAVIELKLEDIALSVNAQKNKTANSYL